MIFVLFFHFNGKLNSTKFKKKVKNFLLFPYTAHTGKMFCVFSHLKNSSFGTMLIEVKGYINQNKHFIIYVNFITWESTAHQFLSSHFQSDIPQSPEETSM